MQTQIQLLSQFQDQKKECSFMSHIFYYIIREVAFQLLKQQLHFTPHHTKQTVLFQFRKEFKCLISSKRVYGSMDMEVQKILTQRPAPAHMLLKSVQCQTQKHAMCTGSYLWLLTVRGNVKNGETERVKQKERRHETSG